jgi:protocatechuate 3,4-dioxygenase beta subunit
MGYGVSPQIQGTVKDAIGQPLPGSSVVAIPERGGLAAHTVTDREGSFRFVGLAAGTYRVDVTLAGFVAWRQNHVTVSPATAPARNISAQIVEAGSEPTRDMTPSPTPWDTQSA